MKKISLDDAEVEYQYSGSVRDDSMVSIERERKEGIKYDNQAKQVEIQKDKLIKDLQNSNFSLSGNSVVNKDVKDEYL